MPTERELYERLNGISEKLHVEGKRASREYEMTEFFMNHPDSVYEVSFPSATDEVYREIKNEELDYPNLKSSKIERRWGTARRLDEVGILKSVGRYTFVLGNMELAAELRAFHEWRMNMAD